MYSHVSHNKLRISKDIPCHYIKECIKGYLIGDPFASSKVDLISSYETDYITRVFPFLN